jgi:starch synthase
MGNSVPLDSPATALNAVVRPVGASPVMAFEFAPAFPAVDGATSRQRGESRYARARATEPGHTIVHFTSEYSPYARTGGLGEAVAGLAAAQARAGHSVLVFMPLYAQVRAAAPALTPLGPVQDIDVGRRVESVRFFIDRESREAATVIFVDAPEYFDRPHLYGESGTEYPDNARRFAVFTRAALDAARRLTPVPTVLHAHDWHGGLVPAYVRGDPQVQKAFAATALVFSVHNAGYQGRFAKRDRAGIGVAPELWSSGNLEAHGEINLLKAGVTYSDAIVTVSPTHAEELLTDEGGFGLAETFRAAGDRLFGICNGIDESVWDPAADPYIAATFSGAAPSGKAACKAAFQRRMGLPVSPRTPVFAMSTRIVEQKGFDLVLGSAHVRGGDAQFVFLGHGEPRYEEALAALSRERPGHVAVDLDFTDASEHELMAGADFVLMPSLYEPCGLTQLRAQRYGAPVVARRVGGLRDTIVDGGTGFFFDDYSAAALDQALDRAVSVFADDDAIAVMRGRAMARHFGWKSVAAQYAWVYDAAVHRAAAMP